MPESLIFGVCQNDARAKPRHNYHNLSPYDCGFKVEEQYFWLKFYEYTVIISLLADVLFE
jgi:hypothetical protein